MDTIKVRKANSILTVPAADKSSYLAKGYDVLGENGKVVEECTPTDTATLQAKYLELTEENKKLRQELESLKKAKTQKAEVVKEEPVKEFEETPKRTTKNRSRK